ncbi:hypothetical protein LCGC14_2263030 [marine sediment metagenome]|uniref:Uncharacterized protein n=1 Tax=marine sediment metagenome TaxID=412755 RepID=A0A0F9CZ50_9ZZZZ
MDEDPNMGVWIGVRDVEIDAKNPNHAADIARGIRGFLLTKYSFDVRQKVRVTIIPDIEGIHYGRGVGWSIVEHIPPSDIAEVSATKIREKNKKIAANYGMKK